MIELAKLNIKDVFGQELLAKGVISEEELATALNLQGQSGQKIGKLLVDIGAVSEADMVVHLSDYLDVPYVTAEDFPQVPVLEDTFSEKFMRECKFVPIKVEASGQLTVAMADPNDIATLDTIRIFAGCQDVKVFLGPENAILDLIESFYGNQASSLGRIVEDIDEENDTTGDDAEDVEHLKDLASEAPVIRLVNLIISRAIESRASDVHIEPFERDLNVRYRIDGILYDQESPPKRLKAAVISRIKIMARLNIAERRVPQDGRIKMKVLGKDIDLRVSTLPTMYGESVVMRILDKSNVQIYDVEKLGFVPQMHELFNDLIKRPYGIIMVTGPTGSGKTTTLYAALTQINQPDKKIVTIEDPVEYQINGINQIHVNAQIGLTFAAGLRSIVRQDPDVIMVGEMRDLETVEIGIRAALTGHLVFSTLHTNDAPSAIARMVDMGAEDYLLSSTILGVLAQRLVRIICSNCKEKQQFEDKFLEEIKFPLDNRTEIYHGKGCEECGGTGYQGRLGIFELMLMNEDVRRLILANADATKIRKMAIEGGMVSLRIDGLEKVKQGLTTISEILRVTQDL